MKQQHLDADVLSAFVDGDLADEQAREVATHVEVCPECREVVEDFKALGALTPDTGLVAPARDLWPAIASALAEPTPSWWQRLTEMVRIPVPAWSLVAATAVAVLVTQGGPRGGLAPATVAEPSVVNSEVDKARQQYKKAIARMEDASEEAWEKLSSTDREKIAESLAIVDKSIDECEAALAHAPGDPFGQEMLLSLYDEKIRVLRAVMDAADMEVPQ